MLRQNQFIALEIFYKNVITYLSSWANERTCTVLQEFHIVTGDNDVFNGIFTEKFVSMNVVWPLNLFQPVPLAFSTNKQNQNEAIEIIKSQEIS